MFKIYCTDGRKDFYQWDINQKLIVEDETITQVHFCNKTDDCSLVVETYSIDGVTVADVPNILFQNDWDIRAYAYKEDHTLVVERFKVISRTKPADYIYTETEIVTVEKAIEEAIASGDFKGEKGDTPVKGEDYYTEEDKQELILEIEEELVGDIDTALDAIKTIQEELIGGEEV